MCLCFCHAVKRESNIVQHLIQHFLIFQEIIYLKMFFYNYKSSYRSNKDKEYPSPNNVQCCHENEFHSRRAKMNIETQHSHTSPAVASFEGCAT